MSLIVRVEQYRYFFDRLQNPFWLEPLLQKRFFREPPPPIRDPDTGTIRFLPWPESRYLARMATIPEAQEEVLRIVLQIPETENTAVHEDLADVALALPPDAAARLVPKAKRWAEAPYQLRLPEKLGDVVGHLAQGETVGAALDLARTLLAVLPDPRTSPADELPEEMRLLPEPRARFDVWDYEQFLKKHLDQIVDAAGVRGLSLFADLLESAIALSHRRAEDAPPEDYSWIWRPAIEEHGQNRRRTIKTLLVAAVRDAVQRLASRAPASVPELARLLEGRGWIVFRRLALHLLRRYPDSAIALAEERLTDRDLFDDQRFRHEYVLLAADVFARVSEPARQTFLGWIEQGPDLEVFRARYRENMGADATDEDTARYSKRWRRDHLAPLSGILPPQWKQRYLELVADVGEPQHPEFASYMESGWVGPTSPRSADDLRAMSVADVAVLLSTWTPSGDWLGPSREGLGRELASVVKADPERFAGEARLFIGINPTYVRALVRGLTDAAKEGRAFSWPPVLELCQWVIQQPREAPVHHRTDDEDPDWAWTCKAIGSLLSAAFDDGTAELPFDLRERAWTILRALTDDPNPTPEYEAQYGGTNMDPPTLSINTTRGEAMHAVVRYALWVRRHIERLTDGPALIASGLEAMPEVREVLEAHLDPASDPSLAIRAVYGQWFPWLVLLDCAWATAKVPCIFPAERTDLRDAAWETYIVFCRPYDNVFEVLEAEYSRTIERLGDTVRTTRRHLGDPDEQLAEHLIVFFGRGKLPLRAPRGPLDRFFEKAPGPVRGRAIEFVGRSLRDHEGEIPSAVLERFSALWEQRIEQARPAPGDFADELANFGWWFVSQRFDEAWAIQRLEEALRLAKKAEPDDMIAERLAETAARRPREAVGCLAALVEADREGWGILGWEKHARVILATAMGSGDGVARETATALIHRLGALGRLSFRDLLSL